jgi:hypothetical protein
VPFLSGLFRAATSPDTSCSRINRVKRPIAMGTISIGTALDFLESKWGKPGRHNTLY